MTLAACERLGIGELTDYAAGELDAAEAAAIEEHLFSCQACAARAVEFGALVRAISPAVRSAEVGGFMTDAMLNRLSREGMRVRTFVLVPGAVVPCAVWDEDDLLVMRLHGDFGSTDEITLTQRIAGTEVVRVTGQLSASSRTEVLFATPADAVRRLPVVEIEVSLTANEEGRERKIGSYTLLHGGSLQR